MMLMPRTAFLEKAREPSYGDLEEKASFNAQWYPAKSKMEQGACAIQEMRTWAVGGASCKKHIRR